MSDAGRLIQVVPRLGPYDGVGDYALGLAGELRARHGVVSVFLEAGARPSSGALGDYEVHRCEAGSSAALLAALRHAGAGAPAARVLLHYVGYGYARRGAPLWLARCVERSRRDLRHRLGVVFHELFASGRPWQSSFWLGGLQQQVTRRLARQCDGALLTREGSRRWLEDTGTLSGKPVEVLPVPSAVGEPASVARLETRGASLVVWGGAAAKQAAYGECWPLMQGACAALGVARIEDVGAPLSRYPRSNVPIQVHGLLPAAEVGAILGRSRFGLVVYPQAFLAKSTLFAAYAAHGMAPIVLGEPCAEVMDGLVPGRHFLWLRQAGTREAPGAVADAAREWYGGHTRARHAAAVLTLFGAAR